jgi:hypothetical protein
MERERSELKHLSSCRKRKKRDFLSSGERNGRGQTEEFTLGVVGLQSGLKELEELPGKVAKESKASYLK